MAEILGSTAWNVNSVAFLFANPPAKRMVGTQSPKSTPASEVFADVPIAGSAAAACCAVLPVRAEEDPAATDPVVVAAAVEKVVAAAGAGAAAHSPAEPAVEVELVEEPVFAVELEEAVELPAAEASGAAPLVPVRSSVVKLLKPFAANIWATLMPSAGSGAASDWLDIWLAMSEPPTAGSISGMIPRSAVVVGRVGSEQRLGAF